MVKMNELFPKEMFLLLIQLTSVSIEIVTIKLCQLKSID